MRAYDFNRIVQISFSYHLELFVYVIYHHLLSIVNYVMNLKITKFVYFVFSVLYHLQNSFSLKKKFKTNVKVKLLATHIKTTLSHSINCIRFNLTSGELFIFFHYSKLIMFLIGVNHSLLGVTCSYVENGTKTKSTNIELSWIIIENESKALDELFS